MDKIGLVDARGNPFKASGNGDLKRFNDLVPQDELGAIIQEATSSVERQLALEDVGWVTLSSTTQQVILPAERILNLRLSRLYATKDPLGKQAVRLWTDYTFGPGMVATAKEEKTEEVRKAFWNSKDNEKVLSTLGQQKSSNKLLMDGEVFFAIFLGGDNKANIRWIDPLEIAEIITDTDDKEKVLYYRRSWTDSQSSPHVTYYRDYTNQEGVEAKGIDNTEVKYDENNNLYGAALIYHLAYNTTTARGNPLLLPAIPWMKYYNKFLSSRIAITLALAKFAWRSKVKGGQAQADAIKAKTNEQEINDASILVENMGVDTTPIKTDTGARNAYTDGRMLKLQVCAAVGIPEQYFGDISIGNLATAKTVELPMLKMFQSYQKIWGDTYKDIDEIIFDAENIPKDKQYVQTHKN